MTDETQASATPAPGLRERANIAYEATTVAENERAEAAWVSRIDSFIERVRNVLGIEIEPTTPSAIIDGIEFHLGRGGYGDWLETPIYCEDCERTVLVRVNSVAHLGTLLNEPYICDECDGGRLADLQVPDLGDVAEAINGLTAQVKEIAEHLDAFRMYGIEVRS